MLNLRLLQLLLCSVLGVLSTQPRAFAQLSVDIPEPAFSDGNSAQGIPFSRMMDHIILQTTINGNHQVNLIFDTGFGTPGAILFNKSLADSLQLTYIGQVDLGGGGTEGTKLANIATGISLSLPGVEYTNQQLLVLDDSVSNFNGLVIDGIIGGTLLGATVEIDYDESVFNIYGNSSYQPDSGAVQFPIEFSSGIPVIEASLMLESGERLPITLLYDTGVPEIPLLLFPFSNDRISVPERTIEYRGEAMGGEMKIQCGRVKQLDVGPFSFSNVVGGYVSEDEFGTAVVLGQNGMLGHDIIQRFKVAFDYIGKRIFMSPNKGFNRRYEINTAGLGMLDQDDGALRVTCVVPGSPAAEQGIEVSDVITKINGINASEYSYIKLRELFCEVDSTVTLDVRRGNREFNCEVKLRKLI